MVLVLDGMTTPEALGAIAARLDALLIFEQRLLAAELARRGLTRAVIAQKLRDCREDFELWRAEQISEMERWLARSAGRLH